MGKKGLSLEEKRQKILEIYYDRKEVFNLKEIEKLGAKKGVVFQTIKDVNQSLVDDNLVQFDKIGAGAFFWSLPSMAYQNRQNLLQNQTTHLDELKSQIEKAEADIKAAEESRKAASGYDDREALLAKFTELSAKSQQLATELSKFERCDPEKLEKVKK